MKENDVINGTYQIIGQIGSGGMGIIYLAYHLNLEKYVVVKKIKQNFVGRIEARAEADIMKNLRHTYLPQIFDFVQIGTDVYTVMDYIDGRDFDYYVKQGTLFDEESLIRWMTQCLDVLEYLHGRNPAIIHSDIKPANIMLTNSGDICLIDFNISFDRASEQHVMAATAAYAPMEQMTPVECVLPDGSTGLQTLIDERTDLYSLGASFYHIALGIKPYWGVIRDYPPTMTESEYSREFLYIIERAMQPDPVDRYQSASDMKRALRNIRKSSVRYKVTRACMIVGGIMIGAILGCVGIGVYRSVQDKKQARFETAYQSTIALSESYEPELVIERSVEMLNEDDYADQYRRTPERKGRLLYKIAEAYYELTDYDTANDYYEEALAYLEDADLYRDYAVSLARAGDLSGAQAVIDQYGDSMQEADKYQIRAEIAIAQEDYAKAEEDLTYVLANTTNADSRSRNLVMLSELYRKQKRYADIVSLLAEYSFSGEYENTKNSILADAYLGLAESSFGDTQNGYYRSAQEVLEKLRADDAMTIRDAVNLAAVYQNQGEYAKAESYLLSLLDEYTEDYRILVQLSFLQYNREMEKELSERNFTDFERYYERALRAYDESHNGEYNEDINRLKEIRRGLQEAGLVFDRQAAREECS